LADGKHALLIWAASILPSDNYDGRFGDNYDGR
jgi:hypothetical protein